MIEKFASPYADTYWHCSNCDHLNDAASKSCSACGWLRNPNDELKTEPESPEKQEAESESSKIKRHNQLIDRLQELDLNVIKNYVNKSNPDHPAKNTQIAGTHYKDMDIEPWDVIDTWPIEQQVGYHRGNLLKYTMRMGRKDNDIQEIEKARHYAQKLKEVLDSARKENRTEGT